MSLKVGELHAELDLRDSAFHSKLARNESRLRRFGGFMRTTLGAAGRAAGYALAAGLGAAAGGIAVATKNAADLGESVNKANVVFRRNAGEARSWSKTSANAFGISRGAALDAAAGYGAMFRSMGIVGREQSRMSRRTVELGADMASLFNQDPTEMLDKLRSGLAGEAEPLRQFGVFLSEDAVQLEAVRMGLAKQGEELTEAQKVQARYNVILRQTEVAHGDFARTSNSLPNLLRRIRASFTDQTAMLGKRFLPIAEDAARWALKTMPAAFDVLKRAIDSVEGPFQALGETLKSSAFKQADLGGKIKLAWRTVIAEPFEDWWASNGDAFLGRVGGLLGTGLGKAIRGAILAPILILGGANRAEIERAGVGVGARFWKGFVKALDPADLAKRVLDGLKNALGRAAPGGEKFGMGDALTAWFAGGLVRRVFRGVRGRVPGPVAAPGGGVGGVATDVAKVGIASRLGAKVLALAKAHKAVAVGVGIATAAYARAKYVDAREQPKVDAAREAIKRYGIANAVAAQGLEKVNINGRKWITTGERLVGRVEELRNIHREFGQTMRGVRETGGRFAGTMDLQQAKIALVRDRLRETNGRLDETRRKTRRPFSVRFQAQGLENVIDGFQAVAGMASRGITVPVRAVRTRPGGGSYYHSGGKVSGFGNRFAILEGGEFVVRKEAVRGREAVLQRLNSIPRYHSGGPVGRAVAVAAGGGGDTHYWNIRAHDTEGVKREVLAIIEQRSRGIAHHERFAGNRTRMKI